MFGLLLAGTVLAQPVTVDGLVALADEGSVEIVRARADLAAAQAQVEQAKSWLRENPELEAQWVTDAPFQAEGEREMSVALSQGLELFGQRGKRKDAAEARLAAAGRRLLAARASVRQAVQDAYAELFAAQLKMEISTGARARAKEAAEAARARLAQGDVSAVDAALLSADAIRFEAEANGARLALQQAQARLALAVGGPLPGSPRATAPIPVREATVPEHLDRRVLSLAVEEGEVEASRAAEALVARERFPSVRFSVGFATERGVIDQSGGQTLLDEDQLLTAGLSIPLPLFDRRQADLARARADVAVAEAALATIRLALPRTFAAAKTRFELSRATEAAARALSAELDAAREVVDRAFKVGQLNLFEYQVKRDALYQAQLRAIDVELERSRAQSDLERLLTLVEGAP